MPSGDHRGGGGRAGRILNCRPGLHHALPSAELVACRAKASDSAAMERAGGSIWHEAAIFSAAVPVNKWNPEQSWRRGAAQYKEDTEAEESADALVYAAARDLEQARQLRQRLEAAHKEGHEGTAPSNDFATEANTEDSERLQALRKDLERLKQAEAVLEQPAPDTKIETDDVRYWNLDAGMAEPEELHRWMQGMQLLSAVNTPSCSPSSRRTCSGDAKKAPLSKKEMANIAEARAMEWAGSPTHKSPSLKVASPQRKALQRVCTDTPVHGTADGTTSAVDQSSSDSAMLKQLDDILGELDEIDRIHDSICKFTDT